MSFSSEIIFGDDRGEIIVHVVTLARAVQETLDTFYLQCWKQNGFFMNLI